MKVDSHAVWLFCWFEEQVVGCFLRTLTRLFHKEQKNGNVCQIDQADTSNDDKHEDTIEYADKKTMCRICCWNGSEVKIPKGKVTPRCDTIHRKVCKTCIQRHICEVVTRRDYNQIPCICQFGCEVILSYEDVKAHADAATFETYKNGILRNALESDADFCWCSRRGCVSGQLHVDPDKNSVMKCHSCSAYTCVTHKCGWHWGRTCHQYDEELKKNNEAAVLKLFGTDLFKQCPKCKTGIEKNGGCNHMTCKKDKGGCGAHFCWECCADYEGPRGIWKRGRRGHKITCSRFRSD